MTKEKLDNLTPQELQRTLQIQRDKLAQLREELIGKRLKDTSEIGQARRKIARTLTALHFVK